MVFTIGLTGGIGSGKSTVAQMFAARGIPVIDADRIARELTAPGTSAAFEIAAAFGKGLLRGDGDLDRDALRRRVFDDPEARLRLEAILHPLIRREMLRRRDAVHDGYCILAVPLLIEGGMTDLVDRVLVVDCDEETQVARACARDGRTPEEIRAIMAAQADRARRLAQADDVLVNEGTPEELGAGVGSLDRRYRDLAGARARTGTQFGERGE